MQGACDRPINAGLVVSDPYINPSFVMAHESKSPFRNVFYRGLDLELFHKIFVEILSLQVTYTSVENMTVLYDKLASGQFDISPSMETIDMDNKIDSNIGTTTAVIVDSLNIMFKTRMHQRNANIFSMMSPNFWILLSGVGLVVTGIRIMSKKYFNQQKIAASVGWYFIVGVILGLVSNLLTAYLVVPVTLLAPFKDMDHFARQIDSAKCKLIVPASEPLLLPLVVSGNSSWNAAVRLVVKQHRIHLAKDRHLIGSMIEESNDDACVYGLDFALPAFYVGQFCTIGVYDIPDSTGIPLGFPFNKRTIGSRFISTVDDILTASSVQGLYAKAKSIYFSQLEHPSCHESNVSHSKTFNLLDTFIIMGFGIAIAAAALVVEFIWYRMENIRLFIQ